MPRAKVSDKQFASSKHQYTDPRTKERVTGVTSVVHCYDDGDKLGAGAQAAVNLMKEGKYFRTEWNKKAQLGTNVHNYAELWIAGKTAEVTEEERGYMNALTDFWEKYDPQWLEVERPVVARVPVHCPLHTPQRTRAELCPTCWAGYGGRFDVVVELKGFGFVLLDFKTGKFYRPELTLQLAAYRFADGMVVWDETGNASQLEEMPHIDSCAGLYLHSDGTYDLEHVEADEEAHAHFCNLLGTKNWAKRNK